MGTKSTQGCIPQFSVGFKHLVVCTRTVSRGFVPNIEHQMIRVCYLQKRSRCSTLHLNATSYLREQCIYEKCLYFKFKYLCNVDERPDIVLNIVTSLEAGVLRNNGSIPA